MNAASEVELGSDNPKPIDGTRPPETKESFITELETHLEGLGFDVIISRFNAAPASTNEEKGYVNFHADKIKPERGIIYLRVIQQDSKCYFLAIRDDGGFVSSSLYRSGLTDKEVIPTIERLLTEMKVQKAID